jgi:hypothetical protein
MGAESPDWQEMRWVAREPPPREWNGRNANGHAGEDMAAGFGRNVNKTR